MPELTDLSWLESPCVDWELTGQTISSPWPERVEGGRPSETNSANMVAMLSGVMDSDSMSPALPEVGDRVGKTKIPYLYIEVNLV